MIIGAGGIRERILEVDKDERGFRRIEYLVERRQALRLRGRGTEQDERGDRTHHCHRSRGETMKVGTRVRHAHGLLLELRGLVRAQ